MTVPFLSACGCVAVTHIVWGITRAHKRGTPRVFPTVFASGGERAFAVRLIADRSGQLEPGTDPELLVGTTQMALDRLLGDIESLRNLAVAAALARLTADPPRC